MKTIRLIHWNQAEGEQRAALIRAAGFDVVFDIPDGPSFFRLLRENPPDAFVIDLSRLPSHGRDVALGLRLSKATRTVPLLFAGGLPAKVQAVRDLLPDAVFASWDSLRKSLIQAMQSPPAKPVVPTSALAGYSGTPLPAKLGIKAGSDVALMNAPSGFRKTLGDLPEEVKLSDQVHPQTSLILWFVRAGAELREEITGMARHAASRPLWIIWPKKASALATDLTQQKVREAGLGAGLVDYKVCAVDETWSGLLFRQRKH